MTIIHVVEPFATGINTFLQELVFSMPNYKHIIIHGEREECREIDKIKSEYNGVATFIKWESVSREINIIKDVKAFFELKKILKNYQYDVLHLHSSKAGVLGKFIKRNVNCKTVVYTPNAASFLRTDISKWRKMFYILIEKAMYSKDTVVVSSCNSEWEEYKKLGIKTKEIRNGVTIPVNIRSIVKSNTTFNIVFCGKITVQKNPHFFNEIANYFKNDSNISFTWIGDGELREDLTSKKIHVTGWQSKKSVYNALEKADLYLSTSSWEGLSLATIEALSFGLPLVLNKCVGNQDIVTDGINGYLFRTREEAIDYIEYLRTNVDKLEQISENSAKIYDRHYNNYRCGLEYEQLYLALQRLCVKSKKAK